MSYQLTQLLIKAGVEEEVSELLKYVKNLGNPASAPEQDRSDEIVLQTVEILISFSSGNSLSTASQLYNN